jgi:hypothetical protein
MEHTDQAAEGFSSEDYERHHALKAAALERLLGPMHGLVGHAIIPYFVGGAVDMYYFPNVTEGTACVTMDLIEPDGTGPLPSKAGTYELIAFTRHKIGDASAAEAFKAIERRICGIFTTVGRYSKGATLNPGETCEVPVKGGPNRRLVFDEFTNAERRFAIGDKVHALLLCIEVLPQEMKFAMKHGSRQLLDRLKSHGAYPYSDLDRQPVV